MVDSKLSVYLYATYLVVFVVLMNRNKIGCVCCVCALRVCWELWVDVLTPK
jgi:hypothetical protein